MYKRQVYKYHRLSYEQTGKDPVHGLFVQDIIYCKPSFVRETKTRLYVSFSDDKYTTTYTLPISFKRLLKEGGNSNV